MILEVFMNITEALVHLFLLNSLIPAANRRHSILKSMSFVVVLTIAYCILTYNNMNFTSVINVVLLSALILHTTFRNRNIPIIQRIFVSCLSTFFIFFATAIAYLGTYYLFHLTIFELSEDGDTFKLLTMLFISRFTYMLMAKLIIYFKEKKSHVIQIKNRHLLIASVICVIYMFTINLLLELFAKQQGNEDIVIEMMCLMGAILIISFLFYYYMMKSNYYQSIHIMEKQKKAYDERNLVSFTDDVKALQNLRQEILELLTPFVQILNNYEYEEARQMLEDYLTVIDSTSNITNNHLEDITQTAIDLKVKECKQRNIEVNQTIKADKNKPSIFKDVELTSIITNLFDISIIECDNSRDTNSLYFTYDTRETGIYLETTYIEKEISIKVDNIIDFLPETLLKVSLSTIGGYSSKTKNDGHVQRKVFLPYAGKAYYLRGANSRSSRS